MKEFFLVKDVLNDRWYCKQPRGGIGLTYAPTSSGTRFLTYPEAQKLIDVHLPGGVYSIEKYFDKPNR